MKVQTLSPELAAIIAGRLFLHLRSVADKSHRLSRPERESLHTPQDDASIYFDEMLFLKVRKRDRKALAVVLGRGKKLARERLEPMNEFRIAFIALPDVSGDLSDLFEQETMATEKTPNGTVRTKIGKKVLKKGRRKEIADLLTKRVGVLVLDFDPERLMSFSGKDAMHRGAETLNKKFREYPFPKNATHLDSAQLITEAVLKVMSDTEKKSA